MDNTATILKRAARRRVHAITEEISRLSSERRAILTMIHEKPEIVDRQVAPRKTKTRKKKNHGGTWTKERREAHGKMISRIRRRAEREKRKREKAKKAKQTTPSTAAKT